MPVSTGLDILSNRRLGPDAVEPKRIKYKKFSR
jgi:hypothetical protein